MKSSEMFLLIWELNLMGFKRETGVGDYEITGNDRTYWQDDHL